MVEVFRLWRAALISAIGNVSAHFLVLAVWMIIALIRDLLTSQLIGLGLLAGGLVLAGLGFWLTFFLRDLWWNYDENGWLATQPFNWLAEDDAIYHYIGEWSDISSGNFGESEDTEEVANEPLSEEIDIEDF